ncbi:unnamed protein product [Phytophthora fragariaefolia]|uniref:Unnamed protein product n=1 Tax=Phytophthora fragariaefolia TaxID=1490495 RepID=A0A9W7D9V4_9STRA|nr:unnamed protein product [Phytophthora fragariaefolia]
MNEAERCAKQKQTGIYFRTERSRSKGQGDRKRNDTKIHGGDSAQYRSKCRKVERNGGRQAGKGGAAKQNTGKRATSSAPTGGCLKCKGDHWLVHCPTASADEKKELLQKMQDRRDSNKAPKWSGRDAGRLKRIKDCLSKHDKNIVLEERLFMPYCADTGADKSIISVLKLKEFEKLGGHGKTTKLARRIVCETVGKHEILAQRSVLLQIMLHTAAGPVRPVKPYEVLVIDDDEDEFILGEDILNDLGISRQQQDRLLLRPLDDENFMWSTLDTISAAQHKFGDKSELSRLDEGDDGVRRKDSRLWVPPEATNPLRCLCIIAHCVPQGHRGRDAMLAHLRHIFYVPHLRQCVDRFLASRLLCHHVKGGCTWINGSEERGNRDILQVLRLLILDYKVNHRDWPRLIPIVQASLNHTAVPSLAGKTLGPLFTGLQPPSPLQAVFLGPDVTPSVHPARTSAGIESSLAQLRASVRDMHQAVKDARLKQTLLNKKRERGENMVNSNVGDYVLQVDEKRQTKLLVTWVGPYAVTAAHAHNVFTVKQLVTGEELDVHASRLKFFADKDLEVTEELLALILQGLEAIEDSWEHLAALYDTVSALVQANVAEANDSELESHLKALEGSRKRR